MTVGSAIGMGLAALCLNPAAFGNLTDTKTKTHHGDGLLPGAVLQPGGLSNPSYPRPPEVSPENLLDALIILEISMFIDRVKILKAQRGEDEDWDFPLDYTSKFFGKILPAPSEDWEIDALEVGSDQVPKTREFTAGWDIDSDSLRVKQQELKHKAHIMHVPVIDRANAPGHIHKDVKETDATPVGGMGLAPGIPSNNNAPTEGAIMIGGNSAFDDEQFFRNFPWEVQSAPGIGDDNLLDPIDAAKIMGGAPDAWHPYGLRVRSNAAIEIGSTVSSGASFLHGGASPGPDDDYNGGALFFSNRPATNSPLQGHFVLQYFCKLDEKLWYRIDEETLSNCPDGDPEGLRRMLYLFGNRGPNLKGHMNVHYWNKCMSTFFSSDPEEGTGIFADSGVGPITPQEFELFKQRMGSYADLRLGLRLCWWIPSGMPKIPDDTEEAQAVDHHLSGTEIADLYKEAGTMIDPIEGTVDIDPGFTTDGISKTGITDLQYQKFLELLLAKQTKHIFGWYKETEYGHKDLTSAYKQIFTALNLKPEKEEMITRFLNEKAHAYVRMHKQDPVRRYYYDQVTHDDGTTKWQKADELLSPFSETQWIEEKFYCLPLFEVLTEPNDVSLNPNDWTIQYDTDLSLEPWALNSRVYELILKMQSHPDFRILLEYIFPISSVIPEVATIYGMEFFRLLSEYMSVGKNYFGGVRAASDAILNSYEQIGNYNHVSVDSLMSSAGLEPNTGGRTQKIPL
tara:strand:- start:1068 stop:3278 length:2211 start_codon:yes stop_codon:yes gene_type:complete